MAQIASLQPPFPLVPTDLGADHLYIVALDSGICLMEVHFGDATPQLDADLGSALIMAVWQLSQEVAKSDVRRVQLGEGHLIYMPSKYVVMVLHAKKDADVHACQSLLRFLVEEFDSRYFNFFAKGWDGNVTHFDSFREVIDQLTAREVKRREQTESAAIRAYLWQKSVATVKTNLRSVLHGFS